MPHRLLRDLRDNHAMVLYLDICCLKRPFDDQAHPRIRLDSGSFRACDMRLQDQGAGRRDHSSGPGGAVMTSAITNPVELRSRGFQALVKELVG